MISKTNHVCFER